MVQKKKPGKTGTKAAKGAKNYSARPYAKPGSTKSDKGASNAKPYHKRPRVITDSATGAALDVDKRRKGKKQGFRAKGGHRKRACARYPVVSGSHDQGDP